MAKIVLDPGHGGKDPGAVGPAGTKESVVALKVASALKHLLEGEGHSVSMTRESEKTLQLTDRTGLATKVGADLFISIHCNAAGASKAEGVETLYRTGHAASMAFAKCLQSAMLKAMPKSKDRGLKASRSAGYPRGIHVVRNHSSSRAAALVELEFISNPNKELFLRSADGQAALAAALFVGTKEYLRGVKKPGKLALLKGMFMAQKGNA